MFTIGRNYAAASVTVEATPLFRLTPNLFVNLDDPSALAQLVADYDLSQDLRCRFTPDGPSRDLWLLLHSLFVLGGAALSAIVVLTLAGLLRQD